MKLESLALHCGYESEATTKAAAVPIYKNSKTGATAVPLTPSPSRRGLGRAKRGAGDKIKLTDCFYTPSPWPSPGGRGNALSVLL